MSERTYTAEQLRAMKQPPKGRIVREDLHNMTVTYQEGTDMSPSLIGLDYESYGSVDLRKHGIDRYMSDPHFTPLICAAYSDHEQHEFDLIAGGTREWAALQELVHDKIVVAHNAGFEKWINDANGITPLGYIDSAMVARAAGAGEKLQVAAPQLLGLDKMELGEHLIKVFSVPGKLQQDNNSPAFDPRIIDLEPLKWDQFMDYCMLDAKLGYKIVQKWQWVLTDPELQYDAVTRGMNRLGWHVDIDMVKEMNRRYHENLDAALAEFQFKHDAGDLNLGSHTQLKAWCKDRGVTLNSTDEKAVARAIKQLVRKLDGTIPLDKAKREGYEAVLDLMYTKQAMGGSSLKKLQTILDTVGDDHRLRDQYSHCGAGQTLRTSGRSVQMQNLKRLDGEPDDVDLLFADVGEEWDNDRLSSNIRQVFCSEHPDGELVVGDFASVESRGLAWLAGEEWKLEAYRQNKDLYKVLASKMMGVNYDLVDKTMRQFGKVGELSCGYQAGAGAVKDFAAKMGVELSEAEAAKMVTDWREANPNIQKLWWKLDEMLRLIVESRRPSVSWNTPNGAQILIGHIELPVTLAAQHKRDYGDQWLCSFTVEIKLGNTVLRRVFHGAHINGRDIRYYKPTALKSGDLWKHTYTDSNGVRREYKIYGGKLAGILTQSFCRELFMGVLLDVAKYCGVHGIRLVGQFHDEIVLDWTPDCGLPLAQVKEDLEEYMSDNSRLPTFPLAAEVKSAYRYIK